MQKTTFGSKLALTLSILAVIAAGVSIVMGYQTFFSLEGLVIVVGGSVANAYLSFAREDVGQAFAAIRDMLKKKITRQIRLQQDIVKLIRWNYTLQTKDLLGLERETARERDPFLRYGLDLVVTGYAPDHIRRMLHTVVDTEFDRRCTPVIVLRNMAATAPAFGMVGTLVGMIILLQHIGANIGDIGGGLGIAMLSTLYGILAARLLCLPAADKLLHKLELERLRNYMRSEGLAILAEKQNAYYMQDRLNSFLEPADRFLLEDEQTAAFFRHMAKAAA